jgi:hypothetical protein
MTLTPKEKADGIVKRMYAVHSNSASEITLHFAKQCALIAVDEILNQFIWKPSEGLSFWEKVKIEINKL